MNDKHTTTTDHGENESRIYTKLKFVKSDKTNATVSFVSKNPVTGRVCGVRQDSPYPKKVCLVDKGISNNILLNVLYDCTLVPMSERNGYVVIAAEAVQFKATITTTYIKNTIYMIEIKFGNKTLKFDPMNGRKKSIKDYQEFKSVLEKRVDVKNLIQVVEDFENAAKSLLTLMDADRFNKRGKIK